MLRVYLHMFFERKVGLECDVGLSLGQGAKHHAKISVEARAIFS